MSKAAARRVGEIYGFPLVFTTGLIQGRNDEIIKSNKAYCHFDDTGKFKKKIEDWVDFLKRIEEILSEPLFARGYEIVRIQLNGNIRKTLQIMIERIDEQPITIDDCVLVSRTSSILLDVKDPIKDPYRLEVTSPGIDRPLVKIKDFQKYVSHPITLQTHFIINGRKNFIGDLLAADEHEITLKAKISESEEKEIHIPYGEIKSARLYIDFSKP